MALYGIPTGAMNPDAHKAPQATGLYSDSPPITPEQREQGQAALAHYNEQNKGPLGPWANTRARENQQDPRYAPIPEEEIDYAMEGKLFEQEGQAATTQEQETPDMRTDPANALASTTYNRSINGIGMGQRTAPEVPGVPKSPQEAGFVAKELESKRIAFDQNKIPKWYESNAFSMGLISFGLNMMSGNDAATSFNAAGKVFEQGYGREKREAWAQELRDQGYDDNEILKWIETGDNKELTDPNEKIMKNMEYQRAQYQLEDARYNVNEGRQAKAEQQAFDNQMKVAEFDANQAYRESQLQLQKIGMDLKVRELERKEKGLANPKMTARDYSQLAQSVLKTTNVANQRITFSDAAMRDLKDIQRYMKEGNSAGIQGSYKSFQYNMARAVKGGGATLTEKDVAGASELTSTMDNLANIASLKTTGKPTQFWVDSMLKSVTNDITNQTNGVREVVEQAYKTYEPVFGHEEAQRAISRIVGGSSVGRLQFDPNTGKLISDDRVDRVGPGTVTIKR